MIADEVGALIIRGDDVEVDTRTIDILKIEGQSNDVEAGDIGRIDIRGDDNDVDSSGDIGSVTINGKLQRGGLRRQRSADRTSTATGTRSGRAASRLAGELLAR